MNASVTGKTQVAMRNACDNFRSVPADIALHGGEAPAEVLNCANKGKSTVALTTEWSNAHARSTSTV